MSNTLAILILFGILALAIGYVVQQKRKGAKCIGCASGQACNSQSKNNAQACNCSGIDDKPRTKN